MKCLGKKLINQFDSMGAFCKCPSIISVKEKTNTFWSVLRSSKKAFNVQWFQPKTRHLTVSNGLKRVYKPIVKTRVGQ